MRISSDIFILSGFILYGTDTESVRSRYRGKFSTVTIEKKSVPWKIFDGTDFFYGTDCFFYGTDLKKKKKALHVIKTKLKYPTGVVNECDHH